MIQTPQSYEGKTMIVRMTDDRILIRFIGADPDKPKSPINVPNADDAKKAGQQAEIVLGEVIAVGPGHKTSSGDRCPTGITEGDMVGYAAHASIYHEIDGRPYHICKSDTVLYIKPRKESNAQVH